MTKQKIKESLNRFDSAALDNCAKYYDLVNLYESVKLSMTDSINTKLESLIKTKNEQGIHDLLFSLLNEDLNDEDDVTTSQAFTDFDDDADIDLDESRTTLKPVKCKALASHRTYWSPYDTEEDDFAKFGIRFRYDDKEACQDAINDLSKDLGYDKNNKSNHVKIRGEEEVLDESIDDDYSEDTANNAVSVKSPLDKAVQDIGVYKKLTKSPTKKSTGVPVLIWILIKLYYGTNHGDPSLYMDHRDLLIKCGVPPESAAWLTEHNNDFLDLSKGRNISGVWYQGEDLLTRKIATDSYGDKYYAIYPTAKLKPWIEGNNPYGMDFRPYQGIPEDPEIKGPRVRQSSNALKSHRGRSNKSTSGTSVSSTTPAAPVTQTTPAVDSTNVHRFKPKLKRKLEAIDSVDESFISTTDDTTKSNINPRLQQIRAEQDKKIREKFIEKFGLNEDAEITESNFGYDTDFKLFCWQNGITWDRARKALLGERANEN